jgi:hypothetical protein
VLSQCIKIGRIGFSQSGISYNKSLNQFAIENLNLMIMENIKEIEREGENGG